MSAMCPSTAKIWALERLASSGEEAAVDSKNVELDFLVPFLCSETLWMGRFWRERQKMGLSGSCRGKLKAPIQQGLQVSKVHLLSATVSFWTLRSHEPHEAMRGQGFVITQKIKDSQVPVGACISRKASSNTKLVYQHVRLPTCQLLSQQELVFPRL